MEKMKISPTVGNTLENLVAFPTEEAVSSKQQQEGGIFIRIFYSVPFPYPVDRDKGQEDKAGA